MPTRILTAAALLLSTAACGGGEGAGNNSSDAGQVVEQTPSNLQEDPNNSVVPLTPPAATPTPAASPTPIAAFPTAIRGRWGMNDKDCDPDLDYAAKGLMVVSADALKFYESRARITDARETRPGSLDLKLAFTGEGQEWTRGETLTLLDDGRTLVREEKAQAGQEPPGTYRYTRCPKA